MASETVAVEDTFARATVPSGQVGLWWLGQSGYALRAGDTNLLLDPFLSENPDRIADAPIKAQDCDWVNVVACTHQHIDHFDAPTVQTISEVAPDAKFVVPEPIIHMATDLGIAAERVIGAQPGESINLGDLTIHPVPAHHGIHMTDAYNDGSAESNGLVRFLGYVVEANGLRVYHAGDTLVFDGMVDILKALDIDVALLPINGRSYFREEQDLVGNMGPRDAVELAHRIGASLLIPMHYDAFPANLGYPDHLVEVAGREHPDLSIMIPGRRSPFLYSKLA